MATTEQISTFLKLAGLPKRTDQEGQKFPAIESHRRALAGAVIDGDVREQVTQQNNLHKAYCNPPEVWSGGGPLERPGAAAEQDLKTLRDTAREHIKGMIR